MLVILNLVIVTFRILATINCDRISQIESDIRAVTYNLLTYVSVTLGKPFNQLHVRHPFRVTFQAVIFVNIGIVRYLGIVRVEMLFILVFRIYGKTACVTDNPFFTGLELYAHRPVSLCLIVPYLERVRPMPKAVVIAAFHQDCIVALFLDTGMYLFRHHKVGGKFKGDVTDSRRLSERIDNRYDFAYHRLDDAVVHVRSSGAVPLI
jgi:hypothetical protein